MKVNKTEKYHGSACQVISSAFSNWLYNGFNWIELGIQQFYELPGKLTHYNGVGYISAMAEAFLKWRPKTNGLIFLPTTRARSGVAKN